MTTNAKESRELQAIYERRFETKRAQYRQQLWATLVDAFFAKMISPNAAVLDLGCGYGEFINHVRCDARFAMDLNPKAAEFLDPAVKFLFQDCTKPWPLADRPQGQEDKR